MKKHFRIEGIPKEGAKIYSALVTKSPLIRDFYKEAAEEICRQVPSGKILDVGTGPGSLPLEIAKRNQNLEIIGIDISPEMIRIAGRNAADSGLSDRVKFQVNNAADLPFDNACFNLVMSTLSFHHWLEPVRCLKEICRVLKEDGEAWIYDLRRDLSKETGKKLRKDYGIFLSFIFSYVARIHSSVTLKKAEEVLSLPEINFSEKSVEEKGIILKFKLSK